MRGLFHLEYLGPVIITCTRVFRDVLRVLTIYVIIWGAHALFAWSMYKPFQDAHQENRTTNYTLVEKNLVTLRGLVVATIWKTLFADDPEAVHIKPEGEEDENFSLEFSHTSGMIMWLIYQVIMGVLMMNILIAIMTETYSDVWKNSEREWKFGRTRYLVGFNHIQFELTERHLFQAEHVHPRSSVPSPYCFLYYITKAIYSLKRHLKHKSKRKGGKDLVREETLRSNEMKIKYFKLLKTLIQRKQNMDDEMIKTEN